MRYQKAMLLALALLWSFSAYPQQQAAQPLTFWSEYAVRPGKEDDFMNLVKTVGQPVRDKLMADGVILAWGIDVPVLRGHGSGTHTIWYVVNDWSGVEKVQNAIAAQLAKLATEEAMAAEPARKKGQKPGMTTAEHIRDVLDLTKTHDYLTRDLVSNISSAAPPPGSQPCTRYNFVKVKPGRAGEYRAVWEKYNKPVLDKLVADGSIMGYGLAVEEVKTTGDLTHFTWITALNMDGLEKLRNAFAADRNRRSREEQDSIAMAFANATDPDAARNDVSRSILFKVAGQK